MLKKRNQKGFTLIEIIAVLVILGILAAVAIPRFLDLQEESRNKAIEGALAAGASQLTMLYSQALLNDTATANTWTNPPTVAAYQLGDFNVTLTGVCAGNSTVDVESSGSPAWVADITNASKLTKGVPLCGQ